MVALNSPCSVISPYSAEFTLSSQLAISTSRHFAGSSDVLPPRASGTRATVAVQDGLGPQVAVVEIGAGPEGGVQVPAVNVVECFDVTHFGVEGR